MDDARHVMALADSWSATGESLLLMADFDGTLTPIVDDPDEAWLTEEMRGYLRSLARSPRSRITVVSGRGLDDLRNRVRVPGVTEVSRALLERAPLLDGLRVERKRLAVAVHYRHLTAAARHRLEDELARAILQDGARLKIFHGTKVVEILPAAGWNKGSCALWILEQARRQLGPAMRAFYLGDDWTDEHAFEALAGQAITVRVGSDQRVSKAGYRLETIERVRELLSTLASRVEEYGRGSVGVL